MSVFKICCDNKAISTKTILKGLFFILRNEFNPVVYLWGLKINHNYATHRSIVISFEYEFISLVFDI